MDSQWMGPPTNRKERHFFCSLKVQGRYNVFPGKRSLMDGLLLFAISTKLSHSSHKVWIFSRFWIIIEFNKMFISNQTEF